MRVKAGLTSLVALVLSATAMLAQDGSGRVVGAVKDAAAGAPMSNVTVTLSGTRFRAVTAADGRYTITGVPAGTYRVRASRLGFAPVEDSVAVASGEVTRGFTLRATAITLETMVTVGYGTQRRADLTGSIASVTPEASQVPMQSVEQALQGKVAGVAVTQASSEPGGGISIRIRGGSSINGNNEPLYVIDGFPVENDIQASSPGDGGRDKTVPFNPLNSINPADIESIDILKDASATAIYGARGANGVVLITTKRGSGSKPTITLDSYLGTQSVAKRYDLLNGRQFAEFMNTWAAAQNPVVPTVYSQAQIDSIGAGTDWQDLIFRNGAPIRNLQLGITGATTGNATGANATKYTLSGGVQDQEGVVIGSKFRRVSVRGGLDQAVGPRFHASSNLFLSRVNTTAIPTNGGSNQSAGAIGAALQYYPTLSVRRANGSYTLMGQDAPAVLPSGTASNVPNPVSLVDDVIDLLGDSRVMANAAGEYKLPYGVVLKVSGGADYSSRWRDTYYPRTTLQGLGVNGEARRGRNETLSLLNENTLTYQTTFGRFGSVNVLGGYTRQRLSGTTSSMVNSNYVSDITNFQDFGAGARPNGPGITTGATNWTFVSYVGRANYSLLDRYLLTLTARRDGSSRFGADHKWGAFPSAGFAWWVSEEPRFRDMPYVTRLVSSLKLRASWGVAGNPSIRPFQSLTRLAVQQYAFDGNPLNGYYPSSLGNPDLTWETNEERDIGMDLGLLDGRIEIVGDLYNKHTNDLLLAKQLPLDAGFSTVLVNTGSVLNTGRELSLTANILRGVGSGPLRTLRWTSTFNYARNRNMVLNLGGDSVLFAARAADDLAINGTIIKPGYPLGVFYGYQVTGILRDSATAAQYTAKVLPPTGTGWSPGDAAIANIGLDTNAAGRQVINANDRTIIGSPHPKFSIGWTNSVSYRGFDLSTTLDGAYGQKLWNLNVNRLESGSPRTNMLRERWTDAWTPTNTDGKYPRIGGSLLNIGADMTSDMLEDGSYTRLRSVTLGYILPSRVVAKSGMSSARAYVTATNLATWTDYRGFNPDVSSISVGNVNRGIDIGAYPLARTVTFGVNLSY